MTRRTYEQRDRVIAELGRKGLTVQEIQQELFGHWKNPISCQKIRNALIRQGIKPVWKYR